MKHIHRPPRIGTALALFFIVIFMSSYHGIAIAGVKQFALVVGIDNYKLGTDDVEPSKYAFSNLKGARNDALRIATSLKKSGVVLPDEHMLIDEKATLSAFKKAWQSIMNQSAPGDVIILTFAGHGGRELDLIPPIDEAKDNLDETLWFWDFDKRNPHRGRLVDDELYEMFERASDRQIVFVADSCHSAGLTRSMDRRGGVARADRNYMLQLGAEKIGERLPGTVVEPEENWSSLRHVTYLTATANEADVVIEVSIDDKPHGALSVGFAEAMEGRADTNNDNIVSRRELANYIDVRVKALANDKQEPGFMPRGASTDSVTVFSLAQDAVNIPLQPSYALPIALSGTVLPDNVINARVSPAASLALESNGNDIVAFFDTDEIYRWSASVGRAESASNIQRLVDKFRLLRAIDDGFNIRQSPLDISLSCDGMKERGHCSNEHKLGDSVVLHIDHGDSVSEQTNNGRFFVFFNLAGSGVLQNQYPLFKTDKPSLGTLPYSLPITVSDPVGRDDFVALFCKSDPKNMKSILKRHNNMSAPDPQLILAAIKRYDCQVNRLATFTAL